MRDERPATRHSVGARVRATSCGERGRENAVGVAGVATLLLLLLGHILVLPPYEGFDETAHYSYVSFLADEGAIPWIGQASFDRTLTASPAPLPRAYSTVPPYEANGGLTYQQFYSDQNESGRRLAVEYYWTPPAQPVSFEPDPSLPGNGAASHPPLYYALLSIPYRLSSDWSPGARLLLLRLVSVGFVVASSVIFWCGVRLFSDPNLRLRLLAGGLLALHAPTLVFEFGRLGNDSLVTLLFSAVFYLLVRLAQHDLTSTRDFAVLGLILGLGLLTKIYFVATLAAATLQIAYVALRLAPQTRRLVLRRIALMVAVAAVVGGWWYGLFWTRYGVLFGTHLTLAYPSPDTVNLGPIEFAWRCVRMFASATSTFLWSGSWSFLRPSITEYFLCVPFGLLVTLAFVRSWKAHTSQERLAVTAGAVLLVPIVAGTGYYIIDAVRHGIASSVVGGYYWFVAWPALAIIFSSLVRQSVYRRVLPVALVPLLALELLGWWKQLLLYAGILAKVGDNKTGVGLVAPSFAVVGDIVGRVGLLSWPLLALLTVIVAILLRGGLLAVAARHAEG